jgi:hypothetical protein
MQESKIKKLSKNLTLHLDDDRPVRDNINVHLCQPINFFLVNFISGQKGNLRARKILKNSLTKPDFYGKMEFLSSRGHKGGRAREG